MSENEQVTESPDNAEAGGQVAQNAEAGAEKGQANPEPTGGGASSDGDGGLPGNHSTAIDPPEGAEKVSPTDFYESEEARERRLADEALPEQTIEIRAIGPSPEVTLIIERTDESPEFKRLQSGTAAQLTLKGRNAVHVLPCTEATHEHHAGGRTFGDAADSDVVDNPGIE